MIGRMLGDANGAGAGDSIFQVEEVPGAGWARLAVTGELDISTALTFRRRLRALQASKTAVRLDLSQVEFIDSAGARAVVDAVVDSRHGSCRVKVEPRLSEPARRYFELMEAAGLPTGF